MSTPVTINNPGNFGLRSLLIDSTTPAFHISLKEDNIETYVIQIDIPNASCDIHRVSSSGTVLQTSNSLTLTQVTASAINQLFLLIVDNQIQVFVSDGTNFDLLNNAICSSIELMNQIEFPTTGAPFDTVGFWTQFQSVSDWTTFNSQTNSAGASSWISNVGANPILDTTNPTVLCQDYVQALPNSTVISLAILIPIAIIFIIVFAVYCAKYENLITSARIKYASLNK